MEFRRIGFVFVILSVVLSVAAAYLFLNMVQTAQKSMGQVVEIVVASEDIDCYAPIKKDKLKFVEIPRKYLNGAFIRKAEDVNGKIALVSIKKGDVITKSSIKAIEDISKEMKVMKLRSPVVFDMGKLVQGDKIELIGTFQADGKQLFTRVLFADVKVHDVTMNDKKETIEAVGIELEEAKVIELINYLHRAKEIRVLKQNFV